MFQKTIKDFFFILFVILPHAICYITNHIVESFALDSQSFNIIQGIHPFQQISFYLYYYKQNKLQLHRFRAKLRHLQVFIMCLCSITTAYMFREVSLDGNNLNHYYGWVQRLKNIQLNTDQAYYSIQIWIFLKSQKFCIFKLLFLFLFSIQPK